MADYSPLNIEVKGHRFGYVSEGSTGERPVESVSLTKNIDFENGYDKRREPYSVLLDLSSNLPAGYSIVSFTFKKFSDADSNISSVMIAATKDLSDASSRLRIYTSKYFNPSSDFTNNHTLREKSISNITHSSGIVTVTTTTNHGYSAGDKIQIEDATGTFTPAFAGPYLIIGTPMANILTFALTMSTCTYTSGGRVNMMGFEDVVTELTEMYSGTVNTDTLVGTKFQTIKITNATGKSKNYYNSFFAIKPGVGFKGQVVDYVNDGTDDIFTLALEPGTALDTGDTMMLVRFPHVYTNIDYWSKIKDVSFEDTSNAVKINLGHESRAMWLGFMGEKNFFGNIAAITDSGKTWKTDWNGFWMEYDSPIIADKKDFLYNGQILYSGIAFQVSVDGLTLTVYLDRNISETKIIVGSVISISGIPELPNDPSDPVNLNSEYPVATVGSNYVTFVIASPVSASYTTATIQAILLPAAGSTEKQFDELGIVAKFESAPITVSGDNEYSEVWDTCLELDHTQLFFLKRVIGKTSYLQRIEYYNSINFNLHFSRRLTSIKNFYNRYDIEITAITDLDKITYLLGDDYTGIIDTNENDKFALDSTVTNAIQVKVKTNNYAKNAGSAFEKAERAITPNLNINSYLGHYYYKEIHTKVKQYINVDENFIGINLSSDAPRNNYGSEKTAGNNKLILAALQQGNINCFSLYPEENVRQITKADNIIGGARASDGKFLLWTSSLMIVCKIGDASLRNIVENPIYEGQGIDNINSVVVATTLEDDPIISARKQYLGTFYRTNDSFYRFFNGAYIDIANLRIKEEYQQLSEADKQKIIGAFYPDKREIWYLWGSKIYIYSIMTDNWKIYEYGDVPEHFSQASYQTFVFNKGNKIYKAEKKGTTMYQDKGSAAISFFYEKIVNHGKSTRNKIPHRMAISYEYEGVMFGGEPLPVSLKVTIFSENTSTKILERIFSLIDNNTRVMKMDINKPCKYYRVRIESVSDDAGNIKNIKINEIRLSAVEKLHKISI